MLEHTCGMYSYQYVYMYQACLCIGIFGEGNCFTFDCLVSVVGCDCIFPQFSKCSVLPRHIFIKGICFWLAYDGGGCRIRYSVLCVCSKKFTNI